MSYHGSVPTKSMPSKKVMQSPAKDQAKSGDPTSTKRK